MYHVGVSQYTSVDKYYDNIVNNLSLIKRFA